MDADLAALQEVRDRLGEARSARIALESATQEEADRWARAIAEAGRREAGRLARMAVEESGFGVVAGKTMKNIFATEFTWERIKDMKTAGVLHRDEEKGVVEIAHPAGLVAAVIPITNPTSTALFKCLIAIKARCSIVVSPHPRGIKCIGESCRIAYEAARRAGAPEGCIRWLETPTLESTNELMRHRWTSVILATGGPGLVKAAYSSGKPAIGVGSGNVPAYIHPSADVVRAARAITLGQVFDNGTICSSEQSVVCDRSLSGRMLDEFRRRGAHIANADEIKKLEKLVLRGKRQNADIVGQFPRVIARMAGFSVPENTTVIICPYAGVGWDRPLSIEKLSPILAFYEVDGEREGHALCRELLEFGGMGHTASIHTEDMSAAERYATAMPAMRITCNSPSTQGGIGYTTNLFPSMTLGCGTPGGNAFSDNIGPQHLINRKRLALVNDAMLDQDEALERQYREQTGEPLLPWSAGRAGGGHAPALPRGGYSSAGHRPSAPAPRHASPAPSGGANFPGAGSLTPADIEAIISRSKRS